MTNDPVHLSSEPPQLRSAARCGAKTRLGKPCHAPAVAGRARCRMHGGAHGSGGPKAAATETTSMVVTQLSVASFHHRQRSLGGGPATAFTSVVMRLRRSWHHSGLPWLLDRAQQRRRLPRDIPHAFAAGQAVRRHLGDAADQIDITARRMAYWRIAGRKAGCWRRPDAPSLGA